MPTQVQRGSAAAGTLTGTALASNVVSSSLTSFGNSPTLVTPNVGAITSTVSITAKKIPVFSSSGNASVPVQGALWGQRIFYWYQSAGTGGGSIGTLTSNFASGGTFGAPAQATTNLYTIMARGTYATVVTTTNQQVGVHSNNGKFYFRGASAGQGGFLFVCRFGIETWTAGDRLFVGLTASPSSMTTGQPSAGTNILGFAVDAADTAITFMHNDASGTATKDTISGTTLANNQGYDAYIFCKPNDTVVYYRLDDVNAGTTLVDTSTNTDLPVNTTFIGWAMAMGNAANTGAGNATLGLSNMYIETDR